jgi:hypothetical protein
MKTFKFYAVTALVLLAIVFVSCSKDEFDTPIYTNQNGDSKALNNFEKDGLISLLETQKMHRDVYAWINTQFPSAVFTGLAVRDGNYMERLSQLVDKYGISNPILDRLPGEFENVGIQNRYNEFVRLTIGDLEAMIENARVMEEEMVCAVQQEQLNLSGNDDIRQLYGNLIEESKTQIQALSHETEGLIHIYAPRNEIRED